MSLKFLTIFVLILSVVKGFEQHDSKSTTPGVNNIYATKEKIDSDKILNNNKGPSPFQAEDSTEDDNGLIEVKEDEIPEGSLVYVLEEDVNAPVDGEIMKTANNIVFRPLFRYRGKQEAQRRNYNNRIRRRYFIPRRSYRQTYPIYYPYRYYY